MRLPIRASGFATIAAGLCDLPRVVVDGWQSTADVGSAGWWIVHGLGTTHHVVLLFGLFGIYAAALEPGRPSAVGAFVVTSVGNALMIGAGAVLLTVLPALAGHPTAASGLDCTPFFTPATAAARALTAQACTPWHFEALRLWVDFGSIASVAGAVWLAIEIIRSGALARSAAVLLAVGSVAVALGLAVPLPGLGERLAYLLLAAAWIGLGTGLVRIGRPGLS